MEMRDRLGRKMFSERSHVFGISKKLHMLVRIFKFE